MRIDYSDWWNDIVATARANASILLAVAAAFVFLPVLVASFLTVPIAPAPSGASIEEVVAAYTRFFSENWPLQLALLVLTTMGQLLLFIVLLDARRPSVGEAFRIALPLFLPLLLTNLLIRLIVVAGLFALIVPGLYLLGRVLLGGPALVAERGGHPLRAVARSWALTGGHGFRIALFVVLVFIVAFIIQMATDVTLGTGLRLIATPGDPFAAGNALLAALQAVFETAYFGLGVLLVVTLYRRLAGGSASKAI